ncbi:MAG TPA: hypothetical protein VFZ21_07300 [Gemmatimonadaceae bacterium]|nr:hypothetical protein [Gemmatimonadaceae bacterium]
MTHRLLVGLMLVVSTTLPAQLRPDDPEYRHPETAVLLELLVPGGGHFYAGESKKGAFLLGGSVAALGAGLAGTIASRDPCERELRFDAFDRCVREGGFNWAPFAIGAATAIGIRVYGLITADDAARRANVRRQDAAGRTPLRPVLAAQRGGGARLGFEVSLGL